MKSLLVLPTGTVQKRFVSFFCLIALISILGTTVFSAPMQTPQNVATWEELNGMGFSEWEISKYFYRGQAADGGSLVFRFFTGDIESFILVAANGT